jgi:hypothetical protein
MMNKIAERSFKNVRDARHVTSPLHNGSKLVFLDPDLTDLEPGDRLGG